MKEGVSEMADGSLCRIGQAGMEHRFGDPGFV